MTSREGRQKNKKGTDGMEEKLYYLEGVMDIVLPPGMRPSQERAEEPVPIITTLRQPTTEDLANLAARVSVK